MAKQKPLSSDEQIERVRRICYAHPETTEKISHGEPTWFVSKKVFAMFSNNHHRDGHVAVVVPAAIGVQEALIKAAPKTFYKPPYVGVHGWVGIEMSLVTDDELTLHINEAWRLIASPKLQAQSLPTLEKPSPSPDEYVISTETKAKKPKAKASK